jgi:hypothetical protein
MNKKPKGLKSWPVFRDRKDRGDQPATYVSPFTEMPNDSKRKRFSFKAFFQGTVNFIILTLLGLALLALVAAFGYIWITEPEKVVTFFSDLVLAVQAFIASFQ